MIYSKQKSTKIEEGRQIDGISKNGTGIFPR
jgi:hypothetical protein